MYISIVYGYIRFSVFVGLLAKRVRDVSGIEEREINQVGDINK